MLRAIGHSDLFRPSLEAAMPPIMPPAVRAATPIVPYTIPTLSVERPSPPELTGSSRNGFIIFMRKASGSLYRSMNTIDIQTYLFLKKVDNVRHDSFIIILSMTLPCLTFVYLSMAQPQSLAVISLCVLIEQLGYGFGFTAYMLYMIYFSEGEFKTSHYSLCTAFMALSMMLPGMVAGYLQEWLGYVDFFWMVMLCCVATIAVTACIKVEPSFGKKSSDDER